MPVSRAFIIRKNRGLMKSKYAHLNRWVGQPKKKERRREKRGEERKARGEIYNQATSSNSAWHSLPQEVNALLSHLGGVRDAWQGIIFGAISPSWLMSGPLRLLRSLGSEILWYGDTENLEAFFWGLDVGVSYYRGNHHLAWRLHQYARSNCAPC